MVVGMSGHQKMPAEAYRYASDAIDAFLRVHADITGVCSLAAGSDQLFASRILATGNRLRVVIPCSHYEDTFDTQGLLKYTELLSSANRIETLGYEEPSEEAFLEA